MLHAFNFTFPATTMVAEAARKRLQERSPVKIEIDADFLDLARVTDPGHEARTAAFLRDKYAQSPPDVVMSLGSEALPFIMKHRDTIAFKAPVVFTTVSPQTYATLRPPPDVTGIISEFNLDKTLTLAERLQPDARRLFVIAGDGPTDRRWQPVARSIIESRMKEGGRKLETSYLYGLAYDRLLAELSQVPRDSIVLLLTIFADGEGRTFIPVEVATALSAASPAPVYAPYDTYVGNGSVGGFVETFESVGIAAADLALEILAGKDPAALPPRTNPGQAYRVDHRAMQRWNLSESNLPPGTTVSFKPASIWDQHREAVLAIGLAFVLQSIVLAALLLQHRRRQRAEKLLKESEERMTFTAASANAGLWQFNQDTGELWATEHCRALFGLAGDVPLTHDTFLSAIHPEDREIAVAAMREAWHAQRSAVGDVRVVLPDDQIRWIRIRANSHSHDRGTTSRMSGIFMDVSDHKAAESEAALQRQEVAHLMRVSVLGQLSGAIAHEINQPLTAILSNAQAALHLLAAKSPDLAEVRDALSDIVQEDNRAGKVVHRLRGLLRKGEKESEEVDLNDLVNSTTALLHSELISRRINLKTELARELPPTVGDPVQLQQVLLNLVMNAMDAMTATPVAQRVITISTRATPRGTVELLVSDHGAGIRSADRERLFQPFYTTKSHGLGLGLTICLTIVQAHGGKLTLVNDETGGAVARIALPAQELPAQEMLIAAQ
jgi:C4-dicarboxylate-specific signal transduction histidine kinase